MWVNIPIDTKWSSGNTAAKCYNKNYFINKHTPCLVLCLKLVCQPTQDSRQTKRWWLKDHLPKMDQSRNQATETGTKRKTSLDATMQNILWIKTEDQTLNISKPILAIIPLSSIILQKEKTSLGPDTQGQKKTICISYFLLLMFLAYLEGRRMRLD